VRRGDTLAKISSRFGIAASDVKTWNHLYGERFLYPGQKLILWTDSALAGSKSKGDQETLADNEASEVISSGGQVYIIRPGDTLWNIAKQTGISVQDLKKWNGIRSAYRLVPGAELKLRP
jgi:membrane-bound lytic murein transglycosylase D